MDSLSSNDFDDQPFHSEAPDDIYGEVDGEKVLIASRGEKLPKETKYKTTRHSTVAAKFRYIIFIQK